MRARALAVGGSFHLESSEANGTRIRVHVPLGRAMRSA
jgi:signal transduction histidine kinase